MICHWFISISDRNIRQDILFLLAGSNILGDVCHQKKVRHCINSYFSFETICCAIFETLFYRETDKRTFETTDTSIVKLSLFETVRKLHLTLTGLVIKICTDIHLVFHSKTQKSSKNIQIWCSGDILITFWWHFRLMQYSQGIINTFIKG